MKKKKSKISVPRTIEDNKKEILGGKYFNAVKEFNYAMMCYVKNN